MDIHKYIKDITEIKKRKELLSFILSRSLSIKNHLTIIFNAHYDAEQIINFEQDCRNLLPHFFDSEKIDVTTVIKKDRPLLNCIKFSNGSIIYFWDAIPKDLIGITSNLNVYFNSNSMDVELFMLAEPYTATYKDSLNTEIVFNEEN